MCDENGASRAIGWERTIGQVLWANSLPLPFSRQMCVAMAVLLFGSHSLRAQVSEDDAETNRRALTIFANAADFQNQVKYDLAAEEWTKLVTKFPAHPQASTAWHYLGICCLQKAEPDYDRAIKAFKEALKDRKLKQRDEALFNLGWALYDKARNLTEGSERQRTLLTARDRLREFLKSYGDGQDVDQALFSLGEVERLLGNQKKSISYFERLLKERKFSKSKLRPDALYALAVSFEEDSQLGKAENYYSSFLNEFSKNRLADEVRLRLADILLKQNKTAESEKMLAGLAGNSAAGSKIADYALLRLGYSQSLQGKNDAAIDSYKRLMKGYPDSEHFAAAALSAGQALFRVGQYDAAIEQFRKISPEDGLAVDATHWLAITLLRKNQPSEVIEVLGKRLAKSKFADSTVLQMDYADALYALPERLTEAAAAYELIAQESSGDALAPRAAYNAAFAALQMGKLDKARKWTLRFLNDYPNDPLRNDVAYVAAEALLQQGEHEASAKAYEQLVKADPKNPSIQVWQLRLAMAYYLAGEYEQAIKSLRTQLTKFQQSQQKAEALFIVGASHLYLDKIADAVKLLSDSQRASDRWALADEALFMLAQAHERNKDLSRARAALKALLQKYPKSRLKAQAEYKLAQLDASAGNYQDAITVYQRLVNDDEADQYRDFAKYGIAWCHMQSEEYQAALRMLQQLDVDRLNDTIGAEARLATGICLRNLGETDSAIVALKQFLQTEPRGLSRANGLYELGMAYTEGKDFENANRTFEQLVVDHADYPQMDRILYELAWNYQDVDDAKRSGRAFERLASDYPESEFAAEATYMVAQKQYADEDYESAAAMYRQILSDSSDETLIEKSLYKLGWSEFQMERFDRAIPHFERQAKKYPSGDLAVDASFMLGECYFEQDKFEQAFTGYKRSRELFEANPSKSAASKQVQASLYLHGGQCLRQMERWDECEEWLMNVVKKYPRTSFEPTALYELGFCKQKQNQLREALANYGEVAGNYRNEVAARARFMMGEVYFSQRDFIKAIPEFQKVMYGFGGDKAPQEIKNWQAKSAFEAARCSEVLLQSLRGAARKKVVEAATEYYEFIVQKHAKHELASQAQNRLGKLKNLR